MKYLTKSTTFLIGPIAILLGYLMSGIFFLISKIGMPNIGLCIILFTIVILMIMMPLTYRQQKFSRMTPLMQPELNAVQEKYKGKNDQVSMQKMNEETQQIYAKYGVNPAGSCLQMAIQMLILFPLYRVIMNVPAYVNQVKQVFVPLAEKLAETAGAEEYLKGIATSIQALTINNSFTTDTIIDTLYKFRPQNWTALAVEFPDLSSTISACETTMAKMNNFLGLNIADNPMNIVKNHASVWAVIGAVLIPILAAVTQWLSVQLSMQMSGNQQANDQQTQTMKTMNNVMPLMSAFFCLTLPVGMGIYWIASAVVRGVQQYFINKQLAKEDMNELIQKNIEKNKAKMEKRAGVSAQAIQKNATINTRQIDVEAQARRDRARNIQKEARNISDDAGQVRREYRPGSLAEKANMVSEYNKTHQKK